MDRVVCALDADEVMLEDLKRLYATVADGWQVWGFIDPRVARDFLDQAASGQFELCQLVTDTVGTVPHGRSIVDEARVRFPFLPVILHSNSTGPDQAELLMRKRLINDYQSKGRLDQLAAKVAKPLRRYSDPGVAAYRDYLSRHREDWDLEVVPAEGGDWLTSLDLYWEMIRGSMVGDVWSQAWAARCEQGTSREVPADDPWDEWQKTWRHLKATGP